VDLQLTFNGKTHPLFLEDGEHLLGRSPEAHVRLPLASVSRRHAILRVDGSRLFVRNLSTTSGTLLDDHALDEGEEVEVPLDARVHMGGATLWRTGDQTGIGFTLSKDEDLRPRYVISSEEVAVGPARDRILQMMTTLFELISSTPGDESFECEACRFVGRVIQADRVVILEDDGIGTPLQRKAAWFSSSNFEDKYRLSAHFIEQVRRTRSSLLVEDAQHDRKAANYQSVMEMRVRSAIVAPLFEGDRVRGILYADSLAARRRYDEVDLHVLSAIARAVGVKRQRDDEVRERSRAARVQLNLLPRELPRLEGVSLDGHLEMCKGVGGDLYLCQQRLSGRLFLAVGDVAGKGMAASLSMGASVMLLRLLSRLGGEPVHVVEEVHEQLRETLPPERFVTLFVAEYEPETGRLLYASAGHEDVLLVRENGTIEHLSSTGLPAGVKFEVEYEQRETWLSPGDLLAMFTDGVTDAITENENFYGMKRTQQILVRSRREPLEKIRNHLLDDIHHFLEGQQASDDITLLLLRRDTA